MAKRTVTTAKGTKISAARGGSRKSASGDGLPTWEQIAGRAYETYCERCRNNQPGDALSDWLAAEAALRNS